MENDFYNKLNNIYKEHNINKSRSFLEDSLNEAIRNNDFKNIIIILNELIGFLRDISQFEDSCKYANALYNLIFKNELNEDAIFVSLINIGNAYRANNMLDKAIDIFNEAKNFKNNSINDLAALFNNLSLVYQEKKDYKKSLDYLNKALELIKDDNIKIASTYVNMSMNYISLNELDSAYNYLCMAKKIFDENKNDFHYGFYLAVFGKYYYKIKKYQEAINNYEMAISRIQMNCGKSSYYYQIKNELFEIYDILKINPHIKGIELSEKYFNETKNDLFKGLSDITKNSLTIGLFGLGSECYFADDIISEDHDFDPGYIVLVDDDINIDEFNILKRNYNSLNKCFNRFYIEPLDKKGVHYFKKYLQDFLGVKDFNNLSNQSKSLITNGKIFYNGKFTKYNRLINKIEYDRNHKYLEDLILKTLEINQYIPYNLNRCRERGDLLSYELLKNHLIDKLIEYYYIFNKKFIPHDKLQLKLMDKGSKIYNWINKIINNDLLNIFEEISTYLLLNLKKFGCIKNMETIYIEDYRNELIDFIRDYNERKILIDEIVTKEWDMLKSLESLGGSVSCQNNPSYFRLMRESQFYVWNKGLLKSYLNDLRDAINYGYNLLAIKYGFMEKTVDPIHFEKIKNNLPSLSEKRTQLQEEIIKIQLEHLNEYLKNNPNDKYLMRSIETNTDSINNASYETYLRGELSSYSENTLYLYAKLIVELDDINIVEATISLSRLFKASNDSY